MFKQELIELRRDFHKHPELGFSEHRTAKVIESYLNRLGIETKRIAGTGIVGFLKGEQPGKTLMLRADMDALPINEMTSVPYKSIHEGRMHACGHDGHMAMLMIAVKILVEWRDKIYGNIKFVFQPSEEGVESGAEAIIKDGILKKPDVDAVIGTHLMTGLETGKIGVSQGCIMADVHMFNLRISGDGGHTALPHQSVDPIIVAANIILSAQTVQTRQINVLNPTSIVFGRIQSGTGPNIIPKDVEMQGTLRCLYDSRIKENPCNKFEKIIKYICKAYGAEYKIEFSYSSAAVINDSELYTITKEVAKKMVTKKNVVNFTTMIGEDFSNFGKHIPSFFYFIGAGNKKTKTDYPHHHPHFNIDEDALEMGVEMHVRSALSYFEKTKK